MPRRAPPQVGGSSRSTKRCSCPPAGTGVPGGVGGRSRWTSWTSDATGGSASGVLRGEPASPATTCVPTTLATVGPGGSVGLGTSLPGRGISVSGPWWGMLGQPLCL